MTADEAITKALEEITYAKQKYHLVDGFFHHVIPFCLLAIAAAIKENSRGGASNS